MNIIERAKNILFTPKKEWETISQENDTHVKVLPYLLIMAAIPAIFSFIGYGVIGWNILGFHYGSVSLGIREAIMQYVSIVAGAYICALVFNLLAPKFGGTANFDKSFQFVAYCYTAICVGGFFYIYHALSFIAGLAGIYSLYLLYLGVEPMMKIPADKKTSYFIVTLLVMVAAVFLLTFLLSLIFVGSAYKLY